MKIFEARYETDGPDKQIVDTCEYVTADNLEAVVTYFTEFCNQYEHDLKMVREVLTVVRDLRAL